MGLNYSSPGASAVSEYLVSSLPWVTSSTVGTSTSRIDFSKVSKFICVSNTDSSGSLRIGFTNDGVNGTNYFLLQAGKTTPVLDLRVRELWLLGSAPGVAYSMVVGLTVIESHQMPYLSGSDWDGV